MNISFDGGWLLVVTLLLLLAVGVMAVRQRWPSRSQQAAPAMGPSAPQQNNPAPAQPATSSSGGIAAKLKGMSWGTIALGVLGILLALIIVMHPVAAIKAPFRFVGWVVESIYTGFTGGRVVTSPPAVRTHAAPAPAVPATQTAARTPEEPLCPLWSREQHVCVLTGPTTILEAPGLPAGLSFCLTPDLDPESAKPEERKWKSIRRILKSDDTLDFDAAHRISNVKGYELTPAHGRMAVVYWLSDTFPCT